MGVLLSHSHPVFVWAVNLPKDNKFEQEKKSKEKEALGAS